ncbi:helix-turn-helix transcriptional regulator [bacterium 210820-DFI.6.37]|nr:helix-turn-helix transcriptional regulator [bacterium 210820-DFI.6.37]
MTIDDQLRLSRNLQILRKAARLSQKEIAAKVGLSRSTYGQIEQGARQMDLETLFKLSRVYRITMDALIRCDIQEILSDFFIQQDCSRDEVQLLKIYARLSDKAKGRLLERGEELYRQDLLRKKLPR